MNVGHDPTEAELRRRIEAFLAANGCRLTANPNGGWTVIDGEGRLVTHVFSLKAFAETNGC